MVIPKYAKENIIYTSWHIFDCILSQSKGCGRKKSFLARTLDPPNFRFASLVIALECPCVPFDPLPYIAPASLTVVVKMMGNSPTKEELFFYEFSYRNEDQPARFDQSLISGSLRFQDARKGRYVTMTL